MVRIALAEDNGFLAQDMIEFIDDQAEFVLKHWSKNGQELLENLDKDAAVDIILMDIEMPLMTGIEATKLVHKKHPQIKILMLTVFDDHQNVIESIKNGANGYVLKDSSDEVIYRSIVEVLEGGAALSPSIALKTFQHIRNPNESKIQHFDLSKREKEVLKHLVSGATYTHIADNLNISPKTVRKHTENIYKKLGVHNKVEAVQVAQANHLV